MEDIKYDAILIDTSIFDSNGLRLESGLLDKLKQFAKSPVDFVLPDVIKNEIHSHLDKKIRIARNALEKSINDAGDHLFFDGSILNNAKKLIVDSEEVDGLAKFRLDKFLQDTDALIIECNEYVSINDVLQIYFNNKPPFAETGKKKNEFPDAIVLLSVEAWAEQEGKTVLAVAQDKDWEAYCQTSKNIFYTDDFSDGLSKFNTATAPYVLLENLKSALKDERADKFISGVEAGLTTVLDGFTPDQEADSFFYWEPEGAMGWFKNFKFINYDFKVIDTDENWVVIEAFAKITVEAEGSFSLSMRDPIDRDYVSVGGTSVTAEAEFESEILITLSGNFNEDINELNIEDVEIVEQITSMEFGTLAPDYGEYD